MENLRGIKHIQGLTWSQFVKYLAKYEIYVRRGESQGYHSEVFLCDRWNYVVKVLENDSAYLSWIDYSIKHQDNPHVPKCVKKPLRMHQFLTRNVRRPKHFWVLKLEKLEHIPKKYKNVMDMMEDIISLYEENDTTTTISIEHDGKYKEMNLQSIFDNFKEINIQQIVNTITTFISNKHYMGLDMHSDNFMMRRDGTIVITDPVSKYLEDDDLSLEEFFDRIPSEQYSITGPDYGQVMKQLVMNFEK